MPSQNTRKSNQPNHLKDLILLFAIPIGIALLAFIAVYIPRLSAHPRYDFIYSSCSGYDCAYNFNVDDSGHISQYSVNRDRSGDVATLYYYNAKDDSTRSLSPDQAKQYQLNTSSKSPDGYSLTHEESGGGFLFWGDYEPGWYLKNGAKKKKIQLSASGSYYSQDIRFLGWTLDK